MSREGKRKQGAQERRLFKSVHESKPFGWRLLFEENQDVVASGCSRDWKREADDSIRRCYWNYEVQLILNASQRKRLRCWCWVDAGIVGIGYVDACRCLSLGVSLRDSHAHGQKRNAFRQRDL